MGTEDESPRGAKEGKDKSKRERDDALKVIEGQGQYRSDVAYHGRRGRHFYAWENLGDDSG